MAAIGSLDGGPDKVYLFSIKAGDLSRKEWDGDSVQSPAPLPKRDSRFLHPEPYPAGT